MHISIRPEKFAISREKPQVGPKHNVLPATVEDIVYQGDHTRYWVKICEDWRVAVTRQHARYLLDEQRPITWGDQVYISWLADDGFMLERYSEKDEDLLQMPPQSVGDNDPNGAVGEVAAVASDNANRRGDVPEAGAEASAKP